MKSEFFGECEHGVLSGAEGLAVAFQDAVCAGTDEEQLVRMQEVLQQLPVPHYRSENCCPESGELSPSAFQRAMMRWQALSQDRKSTRLNSSHPH